MTSRPHRSALYVPADRPGALARAAGLGADILILDLEDAVAPGAKDAARAAVAALPPPKVPRSPLRALRINAAGTPWHEADLEMAARLRPDAVVLPKAGAAEDAARAAAALPEGIALWAMIETAAGVLAAPAIAAAPRVAALVVGTNDLAAELRTQGRAALSHALQRTVLAARAAGAVALDGVCNAFRDEEALRAECREGRALGFDGKTLIHPSQVAVANAVFAPSAEEVDLARRRIAAFRAAEAAGNGVAVLDGRIVEALHASEARRVLAMADAVAAR